MSTLPPPRPVPRQGMSGCTIAVIVIVTLGSLALLAAGIFGYMLVKETGGRSGVAKAAIGMANPDYEILTLDDNAKTLTVRHKKTGKTATFPMSQLKDGRVDPADLGLTPKEAEGTAGAPEWVKYPQGKQVTAAKILGLSTLVYETSDPADKVLEYYKGEFAQHNMAVTVSSAGTLMASDGSGHLRISAGPKGDKETIVRIVYTAK